MSNQYDLRTKEGRAAMAEEAAAEAIAPVADKVDKLASILESMLTAQGGLPTTQPKPEAKTPEVSRKYKARKKRDKTPSVPTLPSESDIKPIEAMYDSQGRLHVILDPRSNGRVKATRTGRECIVINEKLSVPLPYDNSQAIWVALSAGVGDNRDA